MLCLSEEVGENLANISRLISEDFGEEFNATWSIIISWLDVPEFVNNNVQVCVQQNVTSISVAPLPACTCTFCDFVSLRTLSKLF